MIWTAPNGQVHVTHPGGALLFPELAVPTAAVVMRPGAGEAQDDQGDRAAKMPRRNRTRAQQRTADITAERRRYNQLRTTPRRTVRDEHDEQYDIVFGLTQEPIPPPF